MFVFALREREREREREKPYRLEEWREKQMNERKRGRACV